MTNTKSTNKFLKKLLIGAFSVLTISTMITTSVSGVTRSYSVDDDNFTSGWDKKFDAEGCVDSYTVTCPPKTSTKITDNSSTIAQGTKDCKKTFCVAPGTPAAPRTTAPSGSRYEPKKSESRIASTLFGTNSAPSPTSTSSSARGSRVPLRSTTKKQVCKVTFFNKCKGSNNSTNVAAMFDPKGAPKSTGGAATRRDSVAAIFETKDSPKPGRTGSEGSRKDAVAVLFNPKGAPKSTAGVGSRKNAKAVEKPTQEFDGSLRKESIIDS